MSINYKQDPAVRKLIKALNSQVEYLRGWQKMPRNTDLSGKELAETQITAYRFAIHLVKDAFNLK